MANSKDDRRQFDEAIRALESEIANAGTHLTIDPAARLPKTSNAKARLSIS